MKRGTIAVLGGAGAMGRATVYDLAHSGQKVLILEADLEAGRRVARRFGPGRARAEQADARDRAASRSAVSQWRRRSMSTDPLKITGGDLTIIQETLRTGDLNIFTSRYMWLPHSGTMWLPGDDAVGHYRGAFRYDLLYDVWNKIGRPDDQLTVTTAAYQYHLRVVWDGIEPTFLLPHGYMFLDWVKPVVDPETNLALVITGTGSGKTSAIAVAAMAYCVLYPGFHFMNLAPTSDQATLMMEEAENWITNTPFEKFIRRTRTGELFKMKPQPKITIASPLARNHQSWFVCQTVGLTGDSMLGKHEDWTNIDEVQLVDHIDEVVPKVVTRSRGQRSSGLMRWSKLTMLTNPGPNPALLEIRKFFDPGRFQG